MILSSDVAVDAGVVAEQAANNVACIARAMMLFSFLYSSICKGSIAFRVDVFVTGVFEIGTITVIIPDGSGVAIGKTASVSVNLIRVDSAKLTRLDQIGRECKNMRAGILKRPALELNGEGFQILDFNVFIGLGRTRADLFNFGYLDVSSGGSRALGGNLGGNCGLDRCWDWGWGSRWGHGWGCGRCRCFCWHGRW